MPTYFQEKKARIIQQLEVPESEYNDLSPKGSIDAGIRELIDEINAIPTLVTTSSCAGRISVYVEGQKQDIPSQEGQPAVVIPSSGGKGGGRWLFVSHDPVESHTSLCELFKLKGGGSKGPPTYPATARLIHFKFEAMILHVLTSSLGDASRILASASTSGFRESGAMGLSPNRDDSVTPMVAVRSNGLALDSIIGYVDQDEQSICIVPDAHLSLLNDIANERFKTNSERIKRFRQTLLSSYTFSQASNGSSKDREREDASVRRARKQAEGRARQQESRMQKAHHSEDVEITALHFPE